MKSILDRSFKYTPAVLTDISKTIKREQARLKRTPAPQPEQSPVCLKRWAAEHMK